MLVKQYITVPRKLIFLILGFSSVRMKPDFVHWMAQSNRKIRLCDNWAYGVCSHLQKYKRFCQLSFKTMVIIMVKNSMKNFFFKFIWKMFKYSIHNHHHHLCNLNKSRASENQLHPWSGVQSASVNVHFKSLTANLAQRFALLNKLKWVRLFWQKI